MSGKNPEEINTKYAKIEHVNEFIYLFIYLPSQKLDVARVNLLAEF